MKKETTRKLFRNFHFSDFIKERFIYRFFKEVRDAIILYRTTKKHKDFLSEWGFRINTMGQPYTVINLPEDIAQQERDIEPYIVLQLRKMDGIFIKIGITEIIYPEIERIAKTNPGNNENPYEDAFLVVLVTSTETFSFWKILGHLIKYSFIMLVLWILIRIAVVNSSFFVHMYESVKQYL